MWQCHKCSKPVYFAERKQSLGYDWHPECLRCEECGKRLNPGQHAEHKAIPYCHVPCYAALFGPQLFGHGTRVESHKSFGAKGSTPRTLSGGQMPYGRDIIETKLKQFNQSFDNKSHEVRSREVNGRFVLEGCLKVYWGVQNMIHLKEDDDQRTVVTVRKRNSCRYSNSTEFNSERSLLVNGESLKENVDSNQTGADVSTLSQGDGGDTTDISMTESFSFDTCSVHDDVQSLTSGSSSKEVSPDHRSFTLPTNLNKKNNQKDELDELLQVERFIDNNGKLYQTLPNALSSQSYTDKESSFDSNVACISSSQAGNSTNSDLDEISKTDTDYKSMDSTISSTDNSTLTNKTNNDVYSTPLNTLGSVDFDDFKEQIQKEFVHNTSQLKSITNDTLKSRQPIDPSRINDSLKLYSDQCFNGDSVYRNVSPITRDRIMNNKKLNQLSPTDSSASNDLVLSTSDTTISTTSDENIFIAPNRYRNHRIFSHDSDSDDGSTTLKPTTIKKRTIDIKMDCYDELCNGVSSTMSGTTTPLNTPTTPNEFNNESDGNDCVVVLRKPKTGSTAIKRRSGNKRMRTKLKRRCSINGHFYNRETSFFTPPHGSQMSVWITSLVSAQEVVNLLLEKYKVDSRPENFALFVIRDNGEQKRLKDDDHPLLVRIMLGPHEDVARIFLTDAFNTTEISCEVAQFINLSVQECRAILDRYAEEQNREIQKIKQKYSDFRQRIIQRMESLKVRL